MDMEEFLHADVTGWEMQDNQDKSENDNSELLLEIK